MYSHTLNRIVCLFKGHEFRERIFVTVCERCYTVRAYDWNRPS